MSDAPLLEIADLACVRGGRLLFEGLSFKLDPGDAILVTGPNGAGKSSLLRLAAGLLAPAAGTIARNARIALADENLALDPRLSLMRALSFWARIDGVEAGSGIAAMGLSALQDVPVAMLSTGQRKRAVLARVIASEAPLWLLDEPGNGLDGEGQQLLASAMAAHRQAGGAILAASHQPIGLEDATMIQLEAA